MLVDGIYPSLARFVKTVSVPLVDYQALFSLWQESKHKGIESFLGVFKKKFNFFNRPIPFAYMDDIISCFYCCIILHNMAMTERLNDVWKVLKVINFMIVLMMAVSVVWQRNHVWKDWLCILFDMKLNMLDSEV